MQLEEKLTAGPSAIGDNLDKRVAMFLQFLHFVAAAKVVAAAVTKTVIAVAEAVVAVVICYCCCCYELLLLLLRTAVATWLTGSHKRRRRGGTSVGCVCWTHTRGEEERETRTEPENKRE